MLFVLVMFLKRCATCSVVCEMGCCGVREERLLRRKWGEGGLGGCCLRADHGMGSGKMEECSASR